MSNERKTFESWMLAQSPIADLSRVANGEYIHERTELRWQAWEARAQLARCETAELKAKMNDAGRNMVLTGKRLMVAADGLHLPKFFTQVYGTDEGVKNG